MAKFVYSQADTDYVSLEAEVGEEIPVEMAQAWATIRMAGALSALVDVLSEELPSLGFAIKETKAT